MQDLADLFDRGIHVDVFRQADCVRPIEAADAAKAFYEGLLSSRPENEDALRMLSAACALKGDYMTAVRLRRRLARLLPGDPWVMYALASAYGRLQFKEQTLHCLERAARLGFRHIDLMLHDAAFDPVRADMRFHAIVQYVREAA
jgi:tetratricopeptide (TPR) repeat protein